MDETLNRGPALASSAVLASSEYIPKHSGDSENWMGDWSPAPMEPESEPEPEPERRKRRWPGIVIAVVLALLAAVYAGGCYAFGTHYYPGTTVMGVDLSLLTVEEAAEALEEAVEAYALSVTGDDFSWTYEPASAAEIIDAQTIAEDVLAENEPIAWPLHLAEGLTGGRAYADLFSNATSDDLAAGFDLDAFTESLSAAVAAYNETRSGTFDATSTYDEELGSFTLEQAQSNRLLDAEALLADALTAVARLEGALEITDEHFVALVDGATDEELQAALDTANTLTSASLTFTLGDSEVAVLDSSQLLAWISFGDDLTVSLDTDSLTAWATELAESCDTVGTSRTYTRPDGEVITISGGTWGWEVDVDSFVETVQAAVAEGQTGTIAIPTTSEADVFTAQGEADWGAYIDVDISEQMARYYDENGELVWESGVITGNTTLGNGTPTGIYYINAKYKNITLRGRYNSETGEYAWETPVSYWMAFVGSSVGFHDATWQSSSNFGVPGANTWTGSHGCVNLTLSAAEELYDLVYIGLCVIVHD